MSVEESHLYWLVITRIVMDGTIDLEHAKINRPIQVVRIRCSSYRMFHYMVGQDSNIYFDPAKQADIYMQVTLTMMVSWPSPEFLIGEV